MTPPTKTLISHVLCPYVQRSVILLTEKAIPYRRIDIDLGDKPDWFLRISPLGKVPLLWLNAPAKPGDARETDVVLFESAVICEYLDETTANSRHPKDPFEKAQHRSWIEFASATLDSIAGFYNAPDAESFEQKRQILVNRFVRLEEHLCAHRSEPPEGYFNGTEHFQIVDAAWAPVFRYLDTFDRIGAFDLLVDAPNVNAYRNKLAARPSVKQAVASDYPELLLDFIIRRNRHLSFLCAKIA